LRIPADRARRYVADALHAFERAPAEVVISVLLAVALSYTIASDAEPMLEWFELAIIGVLGAGIAFAATLLNALGTWSARTRWVVTAAGVIGAGIYGLVSLELERVAEGWRAAALVAAVVLLLLAVPAFSASGDDATARFRRVTGRIVIRTLAVLVYAAALYAGLALALGAINTLFELELNARMYAHAFGWIFLVLVPWAIVGGVPDYVRPATEPGAVAAAVHRLSAFLVQPLLAIYYVILYAYAIRIVVTGELPKNIVSPLVIAAGVIAALALTLFDRQEEAPDSIQPLRLAAPLFLPLAFLGLLALSMRLGQYGWTEFRALRTVLLVVLGIVAALATWHAVRRRRLRLERLPLILAAALTLAVVGPWNVIAGSRRSQQARLTETLAAVGVTAESPAPRDSVVPGETYDDISSTARYLLRHFGAAALPAPIAAHAAQDPHMDLAHAIGLRRDMTDITSPRGLYVQLEDGATFTDATGARMTYLRLESFRAPGELRSPLARADSMRLVFTIDRRSYIADLGPLFDSMGGLPQQPVLPPDLARVAVTDSAGIAYGELIVTEIGFGGDDAPRLFRLVGLLRLPPVPE
jgi:hypothetical protein